MRTLLLLLLFCHVSSPVLHSMKYFITGSTGVQHLPEVVGRVEVDEHLLLSCDSNKKVDVKDIVKSFYIKYPELLERCGHKCFQVWPNTYKSFTNSLMSVFNQTGGVHVLQEVDGLEWDDETEEVKGFVQFAYDGEDLLKLDPNTFTWIALRPEAFPAKQIWDADKVMREFYKFAFTQLYPEWLKQYVVYGRGEDSESSFSEGQLSMYALDLHFAGTDTTSNTLLTGFLYLMGHPHIQERCQQEIDTVLEGKEKATFNDRNNMPYMQAVIHEVQRVANTVPLSVPHCTTKDTELMGYSIPRGTLIIPNLTSLLNEEGQWKFPNEFNPENFLNDQGGFVKPEAFMPFSTGPRMCLGEGLARMELFLIMVTLLRKFKFTWPEEAGEPDYTPVYGVTLTPKPYRMKIEARATE